MRVQESRLDKIIIERLESKFVRINVDNNDKAVTDSLMASVGQRIRLTATVERYPHFLVKEGATGTVSFVDEKRKQINVKMDEHIAGCEEWDNEIIWDGEECEYFPIQTEVI